MPFQSAWLLFPLLPRPPAPALGSEPALPMGPLPLLPSAAEKLLWLWLLVLPADCWLSLAVGKAPRLWLSSPPTVDVKTNFWEATCETWSMPPLAAPAVTEP